MSGQDASGRVGGKSDLTHLLEMVHGYQQTSVIVAAVQVGLIEQLASAPASITELATDLRLHAQSLGRLVNAMQVLGLVQRQGQDIALTNRGKLLRKGRLGVRDWALLVGDEYLPAWANLRHSVSTGEVAFERTFGKSAWEHRKEHPELNEAFNRVTSGVQLRNITALLRVYDFAPYKCIVDVGGGHGNLLAGVLARYPDATGILFDQPHVVEGAAATLTSEPMRSRVRIVGGSFLESIPVGGDAYLLKHCLHNWDDDDCVTILRTCRAAMEPSSVLLVLENILPEDVANAAQLVMLDIHMMAVLGGRERTENEYATLAEQAGLRLSRAVSTPDRSIDVLELVVRG